MEILSHRGFWNETIEKNSKESFINSFKNQFGTETDLRDYNGRLVVSHDPPNESSTCIDDLIKPFVKYNPNLTLALNIKSDGLQSMVKDFIRKERIENYFVFDMSIPDTIGYIDSGMKVFVRQSEYEFSPSFYDSCQGIWLDCFKSIWYDEDIVLKHLRNGKKVAIVSADLHKRDRISHWAILKKWNCINNENLMLCTDFPDEAFKYFENE